ncbi:MAG: Uma2 family endonuclease [Xanthobacteraceae bacterium]|nr:Uma2 family endonuclease [Xanthobacteraceae bacterium]
MMNIAVIQPAANLPPRRAFTAEDIQRMIDAGVIGEEESFELIEGEIVMMASKSIAHDVIKSALAMTFARCISDDLYVGVENTLQLGRDVLVDPDIAICRRDIYKTADPRAFAQPRAADVLLVVEIAVSSMDYDRKVKARLYAQHGFREYWVIDALKRITWVHLGPSAGGWSSIVERGPGETLTTAAVPGFAMRLDQIV